jgi:hypothetical protein
VNRKLLPAIALAFIASSAVAKEPIVVVHGFADMSCGAWQGSAYNEAARAQYLAWFRGFVTGANWANPKHQVGLEAMPDNATLSLYIDKYCKDHPLSIFTAAAFDLVEELRARGG